MESTVTTLNIPCFELHGVSPGLSGKYKPAYRKLIGVKLEKPLQNDFSTVTIIVNFYVLKILSEIPIRVQKLPQRETSIKRTSYGTSWNGECISKRQVSNHIIFLFLDFCLLRRHLSCQKHCCCPCLAFMTWHCGVTEQHFSE